MNKAKFFEIMKESRVNVTAMITFQARPNGKTALIMTQQRAPNAFLSMHKDGSDSMKKAWDKYEKWLKEFFMNFEHIIDQDHADAIEEDRMITALLLEEDEVSELTEKEKQDVIEMSHEAALVMNEEIDKLSQELADRRVYWSNFERIHAAQQAVLNRYKVEAFENGPRIVQHVVKVMVVSVGRALKLTGYAEHPPKRYEGIKLEENDIPF